MNEIADAIFGIVMMTWACCVVWIEYYYCQEELKMLGRRAKINLGRTSACDNSNVFS